MTEEVIHIRDFPPFIRFELEEKFRREIFATFLKNVSEVEVDIPPEEFWNSAEEEFERSRYELVFGKLRGRILKTLEESPLGAKEIIKRNPGDSSNSIYHGIMWLNDQKQIKKKGKCWILKNDCFERVRVLDLAKITDLRCKGERRRYSISTTELEMATFLWPSYELACDLEGVSFQTKEIFKRLYHTFGSFQSCLIPLTIKEIIEKYYQSPSCRKNAVRIPKKMEERWEQLPYQEKTLSKTRVLEMLFGLDQQKGISVSLS